MFKSWILNPYFPWVGLTNFSPYCNTLIIDIVVKVNIDKYIEEYLISSDAVTELYSSFKISNLSLLEFDEYIPVLRDTVHTPPSGFEKALLANSYTVEGNYFLMQFDYYVDFTEMASLFGWKPVPADTSWRYNWTGILFWQYENHDTLDWWSAMLELYPEATLIGEFGDQTIPGGGATPQPIPLGGNGS